MSDIPIHITFLIASLLILLSVLTSKLSARLGIPALLMFLALGMLAGSDGLGGIYFNDPWLAQVLGTLALAYILFSGGLDTDWKIVRPSLAPAGVLATVGVILTALLLGLFMHLAFGWSLLQGMLLGSIVSSTDAAAVFSILRTRSVRLNEKLEPLLEFESGSNDPMAVFMTTGVIGLMTASDMPIASLLPAFLLQFIIGGLAGYLLGRLAVKIINSIRLLEEGLYPVLSAALALLIYAFTTWIGGNGFLAAYISGIVIGNSTFIHKRSLVRFHDGLAWMMQITMFLVLGLLVFPSRLPEIVPVGLLASAFLMLVARPIVVFLLTIPFKYTLAEKVMISWVGLRGAVPIILGTFPLMAGLPQADVLFHIVFFVVITSVLLQGTFIPNLALRLGVNRKETPPLSGSISEEFVDSYGGELTEFIVPAGSNTAGKRIMDLDLPPEAIVVLIKRDNRFIIPRGAVRLMENDRVLIAADRPALGVTERILARSPDPVLQEEYPVKPEER